MDMKAIGRRARRLRLDKEWSQKDLAAKAKVTPNTIRGFEKGSLNTRWPKVKDIARALGTTFEALQQGDEIVKASDPLLDKLKREDLMVARLYHDSSTSVRLRVLEMLQKDQETDGGEEQGSANGVTPTVAPAKLGERVARLDPDAQVVIDGFVSRLEHQHRERPAERAPLPKTSAAKLKRSK
jgi:transcriptional regulator with XRE-family HTH domain